MVTIRSTVKKLWEFLREASGEYDYARYRTRMELKGEQPMSPDDFYLSTLRQKYSRPCRCC